MSSHKLISIYMGGLILGVNTLYRLFCFFKLFPVVGKGLNDSDGMAWHVTILTWTWLSRMEKADRCFDVSWFSRE